MKYAILDKNNKVRKVSNKKPLPNALPVEYPEITLDKESYFIKQNPCEKWEVVFSEEVISEEETIKTPEKVIVTYDIQPKNINEEKQKVLDLIRTKRKQLEIGGTVLNINGIDLSIRTDEVAQAKITSAKLAMDNTETASIDWEVQPYQWITLDAEKINQVSVLIFNHVEKCFSDAKSFQEELEACNTFAEIYTCRNNVQAWGGND